MAQDPSKITAKVVTDPKLEEEIRRRAYVLYEQRGAFGICKVRNAR